tara:strand:+ start:1898 stop:2401 length:504 start_codon:yes stop_codon:yes gene_type:complete
MTFKKLFFILIIMATYGCGIYSFSGSSVPKDAKSVYIIKATNSATLTNPEFSQMLTNSLINRFLNETKLSIKEDLSADLVFEAEILDYTIQPVSINANENATQNRLKVIIKITYINNIVESESFEKNFTNYTDFDSELDFLTIEENLNELIIEDLIESIFNDTFSNW